MPRKKAGLAYVKEVRAKGRLYAYFDTGQKTAAGRPVYARLPAKGSPQFGAAYAAMLAGRARREAIPGEITVPMLCDMYEASKKFTSLAASSQKTYRIYLDQFRDEFRPAPAGQLERRDIQVIIDKRAGKPGAANLLLAVIRSLYRWARGRGHVANDPCKDIEFFELGEHAPWPEPLLAAALASDDAFVRRATHVLYYTALRIGDAAILSRSHIWGGRINITAEKNDAELSFPIHRELRAELDKGVGETGFLIRSPDGGGMSEQQIRRRLQAFASSKGYKIVPHGLRKNAVISLLEAGCTLAQTATISGQTLQVVEYYARLRDKKKMASAAILAWEQADGTFGGNANESENS